MAPFQRSARRVDADRDEKAAKAAKKSGEPAAAAEPSHAQRNMDADARVQDTDADDEKAPRYAGITSFLWSPTGQDEFLFLSVLQQWRLDNFGTIDNVGDAANSADPDGDGLENLEEFSLADQDPKLPFRTPPIRSGNPGLEFRRNPEAAGEITYRILASGDLDSWIQLAVRPGAGSCSASQFNEFQGPVEAPDFAAGASIQISCH